MKANEFLTNILSSNELLLNIISGVPEMRVSQYLTGTTIPLDEFTENHSVPDLLKSEMLMNMRYRTLHSLTVNHPLSGIISISDSIIHSQKVYIEKKIFQFLIDNSIDVNTSDVSDVQSIFSNMDANKSTIRITEFIELCEAYCGYK